MKERFSQPLVETGVTNLVTVCLPSWLGRVNILLGHLPPSRHTQPPRFLCAAFARQWPHLTATAQHHHRRPADTLGSLSPPSMRTSPYSPSKPIPPHRPAPGQCTCLLSESYWHFHSRTTVQSPTNALTDLRFMATNLNRNLHMSPSTVYIYCCISSHLFFKTSPDLNCPSPS